MNRLSEYVKKIYGKLRAMSTSRKIAYGTILAGAVFAIVFYSMYSSQNKYGLLYSNFDAQAGKTITDKLIAAKEDYKVDGNAIYVLKNRVDQLRLDYAGEMGSGRVGLEIFDNQSQFSTDTEEQFNIKKQQAYQGELERTIESIPQVDKARVHIAMPEQSAFGVNEEKGKVSVFITLKAGSKLDQKQANAIIMLISASLENVPRESVVITDDTLRSYSYDASGVGQMGVEPETQQAMEQTFEAKLENSVRTLLGPALGENNFNVKVNVDMNFDSKERTSVTYDPNKVLLSSENNVEGKLGNIDGVTTSPVDNNMVNYYVTTAGAVEKGVSKIEQKANYQVGSTTEKILFAPGEVTRMTATLMYDGTFNVNQTNQIKSAVMDSIGGRSERDSVSIIGMPFDPKGKVEAQKAIDELKAQTAQDQQTKLLVQIGAAALVLLVLIVFAIVMIAKRRKRRKKIITSSTLDVVIGDELGETPTVAPYVPLDLDIENETSGIENDIKRYAAEKPDQVVDIIKSWLAEDER